ncbi:sensor histidine kinase [Actinomadura rugatobispora]|uniref:histidine kinase n=1 Tax=Actinomadura rugatobispora TaxID=1994 RepID=A0ABW1A3F5_9ACTN|nr:sensor histidine kinase [Actinomadura rugatobispora]
MTGNENGNTPDATDAGEAAERPARRRRGGGLTVQQWLVLVLAAVGLLVAVSGVVGYTLLNRTSEAADRLLGGLSPARTEAYRLQAALLDQETGVRGYVLTGDPSFLEPYRRGQRAERQAAGRLVALVREVPEAGADVRRINGLAAAWRTSYTEPVVDRVAERGPGSVDAATVRGGKAGFDRLRDALDDQNRRLDRLVAEGRADLRDNRATRDAALATMVAAILVAGLFLAIVLHVAVGRPLSRLGRSSRRVADGDFDHVIEPRGPADLRAVASDVEAMRHRIVHELGLSTRRARQLEERTADLDAQTEELRRSNAELEQFAYVASHDLQEPLRKVASFCQLLQRRYQDKLDERGNQYIEFAVDGAKRMQVLINDLLSFSRVGRLYDERRPMNLGEPLDKALSNLQESIEESGAVIERPESLPEVEGDMTMLTMLWQNLVGNAVKFRSPDRAPIVRIGCEETGEGWELSVADNGIGIAPEFAEKIFVIFQRLHGREAYGGTGIGLALCKKIVETHGGRIGLDTEHSGGARIGFFLPRPGGSTASGGESATTDVSEGAAS